MPDPSRELELLESTERNEDPLALDESTGSDLDRAAARLPKPVQQVSLPTARTGAVLSAVDGVREQRHTVAVRLDDGLAFVDVQLRFVSTAKHAAELAYRLPLPDGARVTRVALCHGDSCAEAAPAGSRERAADACMRLTATPIADARGRALALQLAPIAAGAGATVRVALVAPAPLRGGRVHFSLPPRGEDPRIAPAEVKVSSRSLGALQPGSALESDPAYPLVLSASRPRTGPTRTTERAKCGVQPCQRTVESVPLAPPDARTTWLWIDASPSMEGPARSRVDAVLTTLLSELPAQTLVRAFAFGATASELGAYRADQAPLAALADATAQQLGAATHPSSVFVRVQKELARVRPRIVLISDGQFDATSRERDALRAARARGAALWLLHVGDAPPRFAELFRSGDAVLSVGELADRALRTGDLAPLADAVRAIAMPAGRLPRGLTPGEQRVREVRPARPFVPRLGASWLSHWLARESPAPSWSITASTRVDAIAAPPFASVATKPREASTSMPKESVLSMLRSQLVPRARACLRTDRKGRADYAVALTFHALFAQREVFESRIEGNVPAALRGCLDALLPSLTVPAFSGRIRVRYPIHTEREALPPVIELEPEVAEQLERTFGGQSADR